MAKETFSYYVTKYFADYLPNQISSSRNTVISYKDTFVQLLEYYSSELHVPPDKLSYSDFTSERIESFLSYLEKERGISASTRNQRLAAIHSFFKYVQYRDPVGFSICAEVLSVPFKKVQKQVVSYMTVEEVKLLLSIPDQSDDKQLRDLAILTFLYDTAARIQELLDFTPSHFRRGKNMVAELHGKGNKTRLVPISPDAVGIIQEYMTRCKRNDPQAPLFVNRKGEKLTRMGVQYIIDKYVSLARNKAPGMFGGNITNHSFRHSKAMHLLESGVNLIYIRDILGHTSVITTEVYARSNPKIKEDQILQHGASIAPKTKYSKQEKEDLLNWLKTHI